MCLTFAMFLLYFLSFVTSSSFLRNLFENITFRNDANYLPKHIHVFVSLHYQRSICLFDMNRAIDRYTEYSISHSVELFVDTLYLHVSIVAIIFDMHAGILNASMILESNEMRLERSETRGCNLNLSSTVCLSNPHTAMNAP